ncbi:hypothetical protein A3860_26530 [Niastella vici]|uniref:Uncharacterized protein n=1 Tax=Niastella vici TaxID=1703345 RepID=A0A1V9FX31_9BACT|nr:hypothetical protein [Niastella vici]OQP62870.1 hypothetical protein A3860_26530 [Niastella vici]
MNKSNYILGQYGNYYWIEFPVKAFNFSDFLKKQGKILIGKYLAMVCFDGGPLRLTGEEKANGWHEVNGIAYSPELTQRHISELFYERNDQWCLFTSPTGFPGMTYFVNYGGFSLASKGQELTNADPIWDKVGIMKNIEFHEQLVTEFWEEILSIDPFNFIAYGDNFIFISKNKEEVAMLIK